LATENLRKIIEEGRDILCIEETYNRKQNCWLTTILKSHRLRRRRKRAGIVINNKQVDTILINQLSDEDAAVMKIKVNNVTIIVASMYLNINRPIDIDMQKIYATLANAKGVGIIFTMDGNSR